MKILMINSVCGIRSTGRICTDLATQLKSEGHDVKITYGRETVPSIYQNFAVRIGSSFGVKLHGLYARLFDASGFGSRLATKRFIKWVKAYDPDIIHLHNIHGYYLNIKILFDYLKKCDKKVIWTLHDCWAFTGHSAYCDAKRCERWIGGCHNCPELDSYPKSFFDNSMKNWEKKKDLFCSLENVTLVTPSEWLKNLVSKSILRRYHTVVINNGIDVDVFKPLTNDFRRFYNLEGKIVITIDCNGCGNDEINAIYDFAKELGNDYHFVFINLNEKGKGELNTNVLKIGKVYSSKEKKMIKEASNCFFDLNKNKNISIDDINKSLTEKCDDVLVESEKGYFEEKDKLGFLNKKVLIGVASLWEERKGLKDIIKLSEIIDDNTKIVVVGVDEEQKKEIGKRVIGINRTNNVEELACLYSISDYFINPTYEDNYPTTNLESISCGTPVITYITGGSPESAKLYGVSLKKGDIEGIFNIIKNDTEFELVKKDVSKEKALKEYMSVYFEE